MTDDSAVKIGHCPPRYHLLWALARFWWREPGQLRERRSFIWNERLRRVEICSLANISAVPPTPPLHPKKAPDRWHTLTHTAYAHPSRRDSPCETWRSHSVLLLISCCWFPREKEGGGATVEVLCCFRRLCVVMSHLLPQTTNSWFFVFIFSADASVLFSLQNCEQNAPERRIYGLVGWCAKGTCDSLTDWVK